MDSIPWVHYSREEGSLDYDRGFVRLQIHMNFDTIIYRQQPRVRSISRLGAFGVNCCRLRHRCVAISRAQATAAAAAWIKDGFKFLCFAAKTIGSAMKW
jgi:hypothetical protein